MSERGTMKRLLALRVVEEEREEAELRRQRQLRQVCLDALAANDERKAIASRALHAALDSGNRSDAISAEMALACWPDGAAHFAAAPDAIGRNGRDGHRSVANLPYAAPANGRAGRDSRDART